MKQLMEVTQTITELMRDNAEDLGGLHQAIVSTSIPNGAQLRDKWTPVIERGVNDFVKAAKALQDVPKAMAHTDSKGTWTVQGNTPFAKLLQVKMTLLKLGADLQAMKLEIDATGVLAQARRHAERELNS